MIGGQMKPSRFALLSLFMIILFLITTQVFASPANIPVAKKTPGANATEKADEKANKQADKPHGKREHFKGTVSEANTDSIRLTLRDGSSVTVGLTSDTRIKFPGPKESVPTSIQPGMTVMIQAIRDARDNLIALRVMAIPGKPSKIHRVGIVTEYTAGESITIKDKKGNSYRFTINADTKLLPPERVDSLAVGSLVTVIAPRDPASGGVTVKGIVIHPATP
jgi:hypothetical protein